MKVVYNSESKWEPLVGYSRAVRVNDQVFVAGTTSNKPEKDCFGQAMDIFERIQLALEQVGASIGDVCRTRMYVVDIDRDWEAVGKAHHHFFSKIQPVATMVQVQKLIDPRLLVEIEVDAVISQSKQ
ncbi:endoribonuclease L-PSP [Gorgonomyces haynaldii]|nr:endoribonuclease L-PSP [Gorgonomyces haynaldii]